MHHSQGVSFLSFCYYFFKEVVSGWNLEASTRSAGVGGVEQNLGFHLLLCFYVSRESFKLFFGYLRRFYGLGWVMWVGASSPILPTHRLGGCWLHCSVLVVGIVRSLLSLVLSFVFAQKQAQVALLINFTILLNNNKLINSTSSPSTTKRKRSSMSIGFFINTFFLLLSWYSCKYFVFEVWT